MPGAGTDKTKNWVAEAGPIVVLVEPQLGKNIGAAARAMANFGLSQLRLVKPRQGWPNVKARSMARGSTQLSRKQSRIAVLLSLPPRVRMTRPSPWWDRQKL
jgi:hypothetical protein